MEFVSSTAQTNSVSRPDMIAIEAVAALSQAPVTALKRALFNVSNHVAVWRLSSWFCSLCHPGNPPCFFPSNFAAKPDTKSIYMMQHIDPNCVSLLIYKEYHEYIQHAHHRTALLADSFVKPKLTEPINSANPLVLISYPFGKRACSKSREGVTSSSRNNLSVDFGYVAFQYESSEKVANSERKVLKLFCDSVVLIFKSVHGISKIVQELDRKNHDGSILLFTRRVRCLSRQTPTSGLLLLKDSLQRASLTWTLLKYKKAWMLADEYLLEQFSQGVFAVTHLIDIFLENQLRCGCCSQRSCAFCNRSESLTTACREVPG